MDSCFLVRERPRPLGPFRYAAAAVLLLLLASRAPLQAAAPHQPAPPVPKTAQPAVGVWRAWLDSPGGELPFGLELQPKSGAAPGSFAGWLWNPPERIPIARLEWIAGELVLHLDPYDSTVRARLGADAQSLDGTWRKRKDATTWVELPFHARWGPARRFAALPGAAPTAALPGRWRVRFASDSDPAVAVLAEAAPDGRREKADGGLVGTFLTSTGDYRYLAGNRDGDRIRLSCFDGAHAFLFDAQLLSGGPGGAPGSRPGQAPPSAGGLRLAGHFFSGDRWHDTFTAEPDEHAQLADPFAQSRASAEANLGALRFPDVEGRSRALNDPAFAGKARIVEVFGTWCPNCNDEAAYLVELHKKYGPRGLSIVALAFELTGDLGQDTQQVRRFAAFHHAAFPMLIAGVADKQKASRSLPLLDRVRAYPTTIFLHRDGRVRAVHTGFAGPATGAAHAELRRRFTELVEELLAETDEGGR